jgi:hypothetical protein
MFRITAAVAILALTSACSPALPAQRIRFADAIGAQLDWSRPLELEFMPGDRLPIHLAFSDQAFDLVPAAPALELVAKRRCVVRIEQGGISKSLTGDDFDARPLAPGQFRVGFTMTRAGKWLEVAIRSPRQREPDARLQR